MENNKLEEIISSNSSTSITYNQTKENQVDSITSDGINTNYEYDEHGNVISSITGDSNKSYHSGVTTYTSDGLYVQSIDTSLNADLSKVRWYLLQENRA